MAKTTLKTCAVDLVKSRAKTALAKKALKAARNALIGPPDKHDPQAALKAIGKALKKLR